MDLSALIPFLWPASCLILALVIFLHIRKDVHPIVIGMVKGLAVGSSKNPLFYSMAMMLGLGASLGALAEVSKQFGWVHVEAFARVAQPFFITVCAYAIKPPSPSVADTTTPAAPVPPQAQPQ